MLYACGEVAIRISYKTARDRHAIFTFLTFQCRSLPVWCREMSSSIIDTENYTLVHCLGAAEQLGLL